MKNADEKFLKSCFADSAILQTILKNNQGKIIVKNEFVNEFAAFIGRQPKNKTDERVVFETIKIEGSFAMVWAPYKFYFDGKFSHCGVDAFQLINTSEGWKIQYLIDTRNKTGCK